MEFMGLLKEWLTLRKWEDDRELLRTPESRHRDWERMQWLEAELNRMVRAGIARDMAPGPEFVQPAGDCAADVGSTPAMGAAVRGDMLMGPNANAQRHATASTAPL